MNSTLCCLPHLTCLMLSGRRFKSVPPSLAGLRELRRCGLMLHSAPRNPVAGNQPAQHLQLQLPSGPWLHNLHSLLASWEVVASSAAQLRDATALHNLILIDVPGQHALLPEHEASFHAVWDWAAGHAPLRRLVLGVSSGSPPLCQEARTAALSVVHRRPSVRFYSLDAPFHYNDLNRMLDRLSRHP